MSEKAGGGHSWSAGTVRRAASHKARMSVLGLMEISEGLFKLQGFHRAVRSTKPCIRGEILRLVSELALRLVNGVDWCGCTLASITESMSGRSPMI